MEIKASDYVQSLDKGLRVLLVFSKEQRPLTLSEVAAHTQMSRAAARRFLLTFTQLGYMQTDGKLFSLTPKVLDLGYSYISSMDIIDIAKPYMLRLSKELNESCSLGEIQDRDIVYIVQEQVARVMTVSFKVGSRIPAHVTSMGRMILAMNPDLQDKLLDQFEYIPFTDHTITSKEELKKELETIKKRGWALVDQELEEGLRAISTPIFSKNNAVRYAMTIISTTNRINKEEMIDRFLPAMQTTCGEISRALGMI